MYLKVQNYKNYEKKMYLKVLLLVKIMHEKRARLYGEISCCYNYFTKSSLGTISVGRLMIPLLTAGTGQISVDTSNGSKYSDYISNLLNGRCEFYRINTDLNWRFYVRVYYDYDLDSNKFEKKYSNFDSILKINAYFNLLNLDQTYSTKTQIIISKSSNILNLWFSISII